jgi:hypothetical protein
MVPGDDWITIAFVSGFLVTLISGLRLFFSEKKGAGTILFISLALAILSVGTQYKHIEFDLTNGKITTETWGQKQDEAATIIRNLKPLSEANAQQASLIASKLGLWNSGYTNPELENLLIQINEILTAAGSTKTKYNELIAPIIERVKLNYVNAGLHIATETYKHAAEDIEGAIIKSDQNDPERNKLIAKRDQLKKERKKIFELYTGRPLDSLAPLINAVQTSSILDRQNRLLTDLSDLERDLKYFGAHLRLKRKIDLNGIYK